MEMRLNVEQEETGRQTDRQTYEGSEPDLAKELWLSADRKTAARPTSKVKPSIFAELSPICSCFRWEERHLYWNFLWADLLLGGT